MLRSMSLGHHPALGLDTPGSAGWHPTAEASSRLEDADLQSGSHRDSIASGLTPAHWNTAGEFARPDRSAGIGSSRTRHSVIDLHDTEMPHCQRSPTGTALQCGQQVLK